MCRLRDDVKRDADGLPVAFRVFRRGVNRTTKGTFVFDAKAAQSVLRRYNEQGVDVHIDLEHLSLDQQSPSYNPDAQGWCRLAVRAGELWAVGVRWTEVGQFRLRAKLQRYVSPVFEFDEQRRITALFNIALTALPATHQPAALVAASKVAMALPKELADRGVEIVASGDGDAALELVKQLLVSAAAGEETEGVGDVDDVGADEETDGVAASDDPDITEEEKAAALSVLGITSAQFDALKSSKNELARVQASRRADLVARLVTLGAETPATAWEDRAKRLPVARLAREPIASLEERVNALAKTRPQEPRAAKAAGGDTSAVAALSAADLAECKRRGLDAAVVLARKQAILNARVR